MQTCACDCVFALDSPHTSDDPSCKLARLHWVSDKVRCHLQAYLLLPAVRCEYAAWMVAEPLPHTHVCRRLYPMIPNGIIDACVLAPGHALLAATNSPLCSQGGGAVMLLVVLSPGVAVWNLPLAPCTVDSCSLCTLRLWGRNPLVPAGAPHSRCQHRRKPPRSSITTSWQALSRCDKPVGNCYGVASTL